MRQALTVALLGILAFNGLLLTPAAACSLPEPPYYAPTAAVAFNEGNVTKLWLEGKAYPGDERYAALVLTVPENVTLLDGAMRHLPRDDTLHTVEFRLKVERHDRWVATVFPEGRVFFWEENGNVRASLEPVVLDSPGDVGPPSVDVVDDSDGIRLAISYPVATVQRWAYRIVVNHPPRAADDSLLYCGGLTGGTAAATSGQVRIQPDAETTPVRIALQASPLFAGPGGDVHGREQQVRCDMYELSGGNIRPHPTMTCRDRLVAGTQPAPGVAITSLLPVLAMVACLVRRRR